MQISFGVSVNQHRTGEDGRAIFKDQCRIVRAADNAGWDSVFCGQHFLASGATGLQPAPTLSRLSAETSMRIGVGVVLLALHNPVEVAETYASLDVITDGRLIFGVGLGYRDVEFRAFGLSSTDAARRLRKNLDILKRLWNGDRVMANLDWCRLVDAELTLLPVQSPRPPIWMAASSDAGVKRAAQLGDTWYIGPHSEMQTLSTQIELYRSARADAALDLPSELPIAKEIFCAANRDDAFAIAEPYLRDKYRFYADWGQDKVLPTRDSFSRPIKELAERRFILGSAEECTRALVEYHERLGVNHFILRSAWPGMPVEATLESMRRLSDEVLPAVREAVSSPSGARR